MKIGVCAHQSTSLYTVIVGYYCIQSGIYISVNKVVAWKQKGRFLYFILNLFGILVEVIAHL